MLLIRETDVSIWNERQLYNLLYFSLEWFTLLQYVESADIWAYFTKCTTDLLNCLYPEKYIQANRSEDFHLGNALYTIDVCRIHLSITTNKNILQWKVYAWTSFVSGGESTELSQLFDMDLWSVCFQHCGITSWSVKSTWHFGPWGFRHTWAGGYLSHIHSSIPLNQITSNSLLQRGRAFPQPDLSLGQEHFIKAQFVTLEEMDARYFFRWPRGDPQAQLCHKDICVTTTLQAFLITTH